MRRASWQAGWLLMSAVACGGLASNESSGEPAFGNGAGQGNEGGSDSGVIAGAGGAQTGAVAGAGSVGEPCAPGDLAEYCSRNVCPETPDDVDLTFCDVDPEDSPLVIQGASSCGRVSVSMENMWEGRTYHFDDDDRLVGVSWSSDALEVCPFPHIVGRECKLQGPQEPLCGDLERCAAVELDNLCSRPGVCSAVDSLPTIQQQRCVAGETLERFASSCKGSVFRRETGKTVSEWTFDAQGELAGVVFTSDALESCPKVAYGKVAVYGSPCEATGEGEDQCGAGGQGGSSGADGAGGAGGAPQ
jgi:hypothetical protein